MDLQWQLLEAAGRGDEDQVLRLMSKGAKILNSGALHQAVDHGQLDMVRFLIRQGANIEEKAPHRLCFSVDLGPNGMTPLHNAIKCNRPEIVFILLKHRANVNATDKFLNRPLHYACGHVNSELAKLLVGVPEIKINAMNGDFQTPLHVASEKKNIEIVLLLLDKVADPYIRDNNGKTAFDLCSDLAPVLAEVIESFQLKRKEHRELKYQMFQLETQNKELKKTLKETKKCQVELEEKVEDLERQVKRKEDSEDEDKMEGGDEMKIFQEVRDRQKMGLKLLYKETEPGRASQLREDETILKDSIRDLKDRLSQLEASSGRANMSENNRPLRGARREPKLIKCGSSLNSRIKAGEKRPPTTTIGKALFVSWLAHDLLSDDLRDVLVEDEGIASAVCVRLRTKNPDATHSSFYVSCKDESDYERLSDPSIWPVNCVIGDFRGPLRDHLKHRSELESHH